MNNPIIDMDILFEGVYQKLVSPDFGQNLGGELPLFIQQIPVSKQSELTYQANRLNGPPSSITKSVRFSQTGIKNLPRLHHLTRLQSWHTILLRKVLIESYP